MQTETNEPMATGNENRLLQARVGTQWLVGAIITLIPLLTVIYFIFAWEPDRTDPDEHVNNRPVISDPLEKLPDDSLSRIPALDPNLSILESKISDSESKPKPKARPTQPQVATGTLPKLDHSDDEVLDGLSTLSPLLEWYIWLYTDEVVRKFVAVIDNIAEGKIVSKYISIPQPAKTFKGLIDESEKHYLDPQSYERYNIYADIFDSLKTEDMVNLYWRYFPLFEEAYKELGYSDDRKFHGTMLNAIDSLLAAPIIHDRIELVPRTSVIYKFADPTLESLPSAHKQLIRMGPRNMLIIFRKLEEVKEALSG
ncbi:MAG: DUF3014 domain-containing protein [Pseudomonadales bacterium]|nr:DUF3014 domain-containing protein [Pseudomonadales bacterium]MCP5215653.1 DUF3014 domain-containing protein [Pseudomonadales bacterium]